MRRLAFILSFILLLISAAHAATGFRETTLPGNNTDRPIHVSIWYPTVSEAAPVLLGETPAFIGQLVIRSAKPVIGPHPLVVLSHGYGGSWRNMAWLAVELVNAGYVVVAPDHPGTTTFDMRKPDAVELWKRPRDISRTIDALLDNPDLTGGVASNRIAAIGHSLGGWTVVELTGGRFDAAKVTTNCAAEFSPIYCRIFEALGVGRGTSSNAALAADLSDPRIRAVVTLDLGPGRGLTPESLEAIHIPIMVLGSGNDVDAATASKADIAATNVDSGYLARYLPPATTTYSLIPGSLHFSFMQPCKPGAADLIEKEAPGESIVCRDGVGTDRETIHRQVTDMVTKFLRKALPQQ